jgi:hypothetical protein
MINTDTRFPFPDEIDFIGVTEEDVSKCEDVRNAALAFAGVMNSVPFSPEHRLAILRVEEALLLAYAAILK